MTYCRIVVMGALLGSGCFAPTEPYVDTEADPTTTDTSDPTSTSVSTTATTTTTASTTDTSMTGTTASTTVDPSTTETADTTDSDPTTTTDTETDPTTTTDPTTESSTGADPMCGNGMPEGDEECDDGNLVNTDACKNDCTNAVCGDGVTGPKEECDDGNDDDSDLCTTLCTEAECGDGFVQGGEGCDDGNLVDHDGCDNSCVEEPFCEAFEGFECPTGAIQVCDTAAIQCDSMEDAIAACEACFGGDAMCQGFQDVDGCNEGNGVEDQNAQCPGRLNFVYQGDVCNNGIVTDPCDFGSITGEWCSP
jgi:cysteine-rich repeat protein